MHLSAYIRTKTVIILLYCMYKYVTSQDGKIIFTILVLQKKDYTLVNEVVLSVIYNTKYLVNFMQGTRLSRKVNDIEWGDLSRTVLQVSTVHM